MHHPTDRITHTTAFVTLVVEHWLEREIAQWVHPMKDRSDDPSHHERTLYLYATSRSRVNGTVPKRPPPPPPPRSILAETDCVVHCPTVGKKHLNVRSTVADVVNHFTHFPFGGTKYSVLTNIVCMCWAGKNERAKIFLTNF